MRIILTSDESGAAGIVRVTNWPYSLSDVDDDGKIQASGDTGEVRKFDGKGVWELRRSKMAGNGKPYVAIWLDFEAGRPKNDVPNTGQSLMAGGEDGDRLTLSHASDPDVCPSLRFTRR